MEAFESFKAEVQNIETVIPPSAGGAVRDLAIQSGDNRSRNRLRRAYKETVMAVSHYDDVYDEPLDTNVAAELTPDVATGQAPDGPPFTDTVKTSVIVAIERTIERRGK